MGRAEVGTPKYVANQMKAKGLQRLRWYCQPCEKQCRDENGFKCHTMSESHLRNILNISTASKSKIDEYSREFQSEFVRLLRASHGEKLINANRFYQEYIADKQHVHMNATRWSSLAQFVKYLGEMKICKVEESEKEGLCIAYIDNSAEAIERKEFLKKQREMDDHETQEKLLQRQIEKANKMKKVDDKEQDTDRFNLKRDSSEKVSIKPAITGSSAGVKKAPVKASNVFSSIKKSGKVTKPTQTLKKPQNAFERLMLQRK